MSVDRILSFVTDEASRVATARGLRVTVSSNITPSVVVYDARETGPSILDALGVKTHINVTTADGAQLASYGEPVTFDPVRAAVYYGAVALLGFSIVALLARSIRR